MTDVGGFGVEVEAIERGTKDHLASLINGGGKPAFGEEAEEIFIVKPAQFPFGVEVSEEIEDLFIEERVANFDGRVHGNAVAFGLEEVTCERDPAGDPDAPIERVPVFGAVEGHLEIGPGVGLHADGVHGIGIEAEFGGTEETVGIDPGVGATDGVFDIAAELP